MSQPPIDSLEPPFDLPLFARALRTAFSRQTPPSISLPSALGPEAIETLRELARPLLHQYDLADRGRYRFVDLRDKDGNSSRALSAFAPLLLALRAFACEVSGKDLRDGPARVVWLEEGDYAVRQDDARARPAANFLEASLDLSPDAGDPAACVYSVLPVIHVPIAQLPGQISLVERGPYSTRCDRYRSCLMEGRAFVLLRAQFPLAQS